MFLNRVSDAIMVTSQYLVDDVDPVVELLSLQDGVQVQQPVLQVFVSVPERDDDGDLLLRHAVFGCVASAQLHVGVILLYLLHNHGNVELYPQRTH